MKTSLYIIAVMLFPFISTAQSESYKVDAQKSELQWKAEKVTGFHNGTLAFKDGQVAMLNGKLTSASVSVDMPSLKVLDISDPGTNASLVKHLWSDDFFSIDKFAVSSFELKSIQPGENDTWTATGQFTIKGVVQTLTFPVVYKVKDNLLVIIADMMIDRTKFGIRYGSGSFFEGLGDSMIYDEFNVKLKIVATREQIKTVSK